MARTTSSEALKSKQRQRDGKQKGGKGAKIARKKGSDGKGKGVGVEKKKRKYRPGTRALLEIKKQQKSTDLCIRKAPFCRYELILSRGR